MTHVPSRRPRFSAERIRGKIRKIARRLEREYRGSDLVLVGVLKGATFFLCDLARELAIPVRIDFLRVRSYGPATSPGKRVEITKDVEMEVAGKDVLIVDDIVDTGGSMAHLRRHFDRKKAKSLRFCALVDKWGRRKAGVKIDYRGFRLKSGFLVGYGMDHAESFRELPDIHTLVPSRGEKSGPGGRR